MLTVKTKNFNVKVKERPRAPNRKIWGFVIIT